MFKYKYLLLESFAELTLDPTLQNIKDNDDFSFTFFYPDEPMREYRVTYLSYSHALEEIEKFFGKKLSDFKNVFLIIQRGLNSLRKKPGMESIPNLSLNIFSTSLQRGIVLKRQGSSNIFELKTAKNENELNMSKYANPKFEREIWVESKKREALIIVD